MGKDVSRHTLSYRAWNRRVGSCLAFVVQRPLERPDSSGVARLTPIPLSSARSSTPRTRAPSLHRRYPVSSGRLSPSDACGARLPMEPLPGRPGSPTGLPCCESPRVYVPRPLPRRAGRPSRVGVWYLDGLRLLRGDSALAFNFSGPAQASLALRPANCWPAQGGPLSPELRRLGRPRHRPGSYQGVPTLLGPNSPAALIHLSRRTLRSCRSPTARWQSPAVVGRHASWGQSRAAAGLPRRVRVSSQSSPATHGRLSAPARLGAGRAPTPYERIRGLGTWRRIRRDRTCWGLLKQPDIALGKAWKRRSRT